MHITQSYLGTPRSLYPRLADARSATPQQARCSRPRTLLEAVAALLQQQLQQEQIQVCLASTTTIITI